jgi:hypothetical protein
MQIYVDLDGVLADFDKHHETVFGVRADKQADNVDWRAVRAVPDFYLNLPPMSDMRELWDYVKPYKPIVLTGVPASVKEAPMNKIAWVEKHLGAGVPVICCRSKDKFRQALPGDILIDDWEKHRHLWEGAGGVWITHRSASETITALRARGI